MGEVPDCGLAKAQRPVVAQTVVMVVGAGRGPLIRASLAAAAAAGRRVRVWAVEKNVNAVVHIEALVAAEGCAALLPARHASPHPAHVTQYAAPPRHGGR